MQERNQMQGRDQMQERNQTQERNQMQERNQIMQGKDQMQEFENKFSIHTKNSLTFACPSGLDRLCFVPVLNDCKAMGVFWLIEFSPNLVQKAAEGILELGYILTNEENKTQCLSQAKQLAKELLLKKHESKEEIAKTVLNIYTLESFLYRELNRALREGDKTRACISYFAHLINCSLKYFVDNDKCKVYKGLLYRGCYLNEDQQQQYILAYQGKHPKTYNNYFTWYGYTSTTKDRNYAEKFGNTLFIIKVKNTDSFNYPTSVEIENLSKYPQEKEVLNLPCNHFKVTNFQYENNKMIIYLTQTLLWP